MSIMNWQIYAQKELIVRGGDDSARYFGLDEVIEANERVTCLVRTTKDLVTAFDLYHGDPTDPDTEPLLACSSVDVDPFYSNNAECTSSRAVTATKAYVAVYLGKSFTESKQPTKLQVICGKEPEVVDLVNGVALKKQVGTVDDDTVIHVYRLQDARRGERVTCRIRGPNGDANLYVRLGDRAHLLSGTTDCKAYDKGSSKGKCTVRVRDDTSVYATVQAKRSYTNLSVKCIRDQTTCKNPGVRCRKTRECCGSGYTCDGTRAFRKTCRVALKRGDKCVRSSQCSLHATCMNNRCSRG